MGTSTVVHRFIGAYAPWDPGSTEGRRFWSSLATFVNTTSTSWTIAGDLNTTVSAIERPSDNARDRAPYLAFLDSLLESDLYESTITDDASFTDVYQRFTDIMIPSAIKAYGRVARYSRCTNDRVSNPQIEKLVARLRFTGGAIRAIRNTNGPPLSFGALTALNRILTNYYALANTDTTLLQYAVLEKRQLHRDLYAARTSEIQARKERQDRARITNALRGGSTKRLVNPGDDPTQVQEISRDYWSNLYKHEEPPDIPKPWLTMEA
ncbi:hypothetical protein B0H13DRAFT_2364654 [Mycena leptocephala]|nr:hypothetical protein B0H13DRAFT_2364654 [Mycena leptocephala]